MTNIIAERYKKMSNSELLEVLQNRHQYQSAAIAIAKSEFDSRQLSEEDIREAKNILSDKNSKKEQQQEKIEAAKSKVKNAGNTLYDTINPIQTGTPTSTKLIRFITLIFSGLLIYKVFSDFDFFVAVIKGDSHESFAYTIFIFPIIVETGALLLFWLRKKWGWILLAAFCSYSLMEAFYNLYYSIAFQFKEHAFSFLQHTPSPLAFLFAVLFYIGTLFAMQKQVMREIYKIDTREMISSIVAGAVAGILFLSILIFS